MSCQAAYLSAFNVSSKLVSAGLMQQIMTVRLLPPRESWSMRVSFESRYGTCVELEPRFPPPQARPYMEGCVLLGFFVQEFEFFVGASEPRPERLESPRALMTLPRARRPRLMLMPSFMRLPSAPTQSYTVHVSLRTDFISHIARTSVILRSRQRIKWRNRDKNGAKWGVGRAGGYGERWGVGLVLA